MLGLAGLELPALSERARDGINGILKDFGWAANPADVTGFARKDEFVQIIDYMIEEPEVGTLVVASAGAGNQPDHVIALRDRTDKNVAFFYTASRNDKSLEKLKKANIPIFYSPDKLASGLKSLNDYHAWLDERAARGRVEAPSVTEAQRQAIGKLRALGRESLSESESKQLIAAWGVPAGREIQVYSQGAAVEAAQRIGYPVALKVDSPDILHKTEAGVVRLGLANEDEVRAAYEEIVSNATRYAPRASIGAVSVQEMVAGGVEVIVGIKYDVQLGPMLVFGSGGVMVEVFGDVATRHCPVSRGEALEMIGEIKGSKLLRGFRGRPAADIDALADTLVRMSHMAVQLEGELAEIDVNPLMVLPAGQGVKAVDALVLLRPA
jgi:acetyltransferase